MSNQWCRRRGCRGCKRTPKPQKFGFVENPGKIPENVGNNSENLWQIPWKSKQNPQVSRKNPWKSGHNGAQHCLTSKNWLPRFAEKHVKTFLGDTPQKRWAKVPRQLSWKVCENLGKNALHPQEFACSYIYLSNDQQWFNNVLVHWHFCVLKVIWFKNWLKK